MLWQAEARQGNRNGSAMLEFPERSPKNRKGCGQVATGYLAVARANAPEGCTRPISWQLRANYLVAFSAGVGKIVV